MLSSKDVKTGVLGLLDGSTALSLADPIFHIIYENH